MGRVYVLIPGPRLPLPNISEINEFRGPYDFALTLGVLQIFLLYVIKNAWRLFTFCLYISVEFEKYFDEIIYSISGIPKKGY